ncbi:hypothetical protein [Bacteroides zoogleoformans]|uniref:hypothetical protein n=1 Tax=Bacteroides zoogleoformans TaxID=28119 RepID=UPI00248DAB41|nr:hypothetical protein [Bacteroides zoogleoformans]
MNEKNVGTAKPSALFFSGQRLEAGTFSFPLTMIPLPYKNKGFQMDMSKRGEEEAEKKRKLTGKNGKRICYQEKKK